jgi:acetylornithine deacetylase/succinyl-diaminopimelate desuccinylase-like protein
MTSPLEVVLAQLERDRDGAIERWKELLRIPSISTDQTYRQETRRAAEWLVQNLSAIGFAAEVREAEGHPMVVGHHPGPGNGGAPHVLYYGHYDVQPPEPLELWQTPPFEPTVVDGPRGQRMIARGAVDDKGQVMTWLEAFRAWHAVHGGMPVPITVFIEGEEESGSPSLEPFLEANRAAFAGADVCVVSDTCAWDVDTPALCTRLRGMLYTEITLSAAAHDLHSGLYGGAVPNPLNILARILGQLHDDDGRVRLPRFYDDVREPDAAEREQWAALGFDETAFLSNVGLRRGWGETGRSTLERLWARPTCDVNGIWGGYAGAGTKTVIPAAAHAKVSFRLVPEQDPAKVLAGLEKFLADRTPPDCRVGLTTHGASAAIRVPTDSPYLQVYGRAPVLIGMGGSIPAVEAIRRLLGMDSLLVGFGLDDDRIHSPNEKFELVCFERGMRTHARMLDGFARLRGTA